MCSWEAEELEFNPRPSGAKALTVAPPLQVVEGAGARRPELRASCSGGAGGRPSCGWDVRGLEPAPDLEAVGSP